MAITEQSRKELYQRLEDVLGDEPAATLMEHLPSTGWRDVATKDDLDQLEERLTLRFDRDLARIESSLNERMSALDRALTTGMNALEREMTELRLSFEHYREATDRRFDELHEHFLGKAEFDKTITAQTIALVVFMAALVTRMGG